ncbi:TPA: toxic anion resistance protein [Acinetobacter baumannii]|uniref:toxic anion resistance protein n=1 Tax=Acinetobacter baumannii TaxID=470 RepID=UPI00338EB806
MTTNKPAVVQVTNEKVENALQSMANERNLTLPKLLGEKIDIYSPENIKRINAIKSALDGNLTSDRISNFGEGLSKHSSEYTQKLLGNVNNSDLDELGKGLTTLVQDTREFSKKAIAIRDGKNSIPIIGKFLERFKDKREQSKILYETTEQSVDRMITYLDERQKGVLATNKALNEMFEGVVKEAEDIGFYLISAQIRLDELRAELSELASQQDSENPDQFLNQKIFDTNSAVNALEKRIEDLYMFQQVAFLSLPQIRLTQQTNMEISDKFNNVKTLTVPMWKRSYAMAITLHDQQQNLATIDRVEAHNNTMLRDLADKVKVNAINAAKASNRTSVEIQTIEYMQSQLEETIVTINQMREDGVKKREENIKRISNRKGFADMVIDNVDKNLLPGENGNA